MEGLAGLLILLVIGVLAAGPAAFIMALVLFGRIGKLEEKMRWLSAGQKPPAPPKYTPLPAAPPISAERESAPAAQVELHWPVKPTTPPPAAVEKPAPVSPPRPVAPTLPYPPIKPDMPKLPSAGLELKIGTTVALIAGIITVIVGVGYFLKYMYDHAYFGPMARVCVVAGGGLSAMLIGEITRRRGYEIVAKGTTALGFALLYAAVFSASRVYMLIEMQTAFLLAIVITAGAMAYAVTLNEVAIAFLSLLGGYLSPIIISSGQNLAMPLFSYLLALAVGALACAMFRRWRAVNWIAMVGTYLLFTGWFEKFYTPAQMAMTLTWLGIFGGLFLVQPLVFGLMRKVAARAEDVGLVVTNSVAVFYYLWRILYAEHPQAQAIAAAAVGAAHLLLLAAAMIRCRDDRKLQAALGVLGTAFITAAIPLYFSRLNPMLLSWSLEAVVLTFIGIRYRSLWTKAMALIVSAIAVVGLFYHLPLHTGIFLAVINAPFGTWMAVSAALLICHLLWRFLSQSQDAEGRLLTQVYYILGVLLTMLGIGLEWYAHCRWNSGVQNSEAIFLQGMIVVVLAIAAALLFRPCCPQGVLTLGAGTLAAFFGAVFVAMAMMGVYHTPFKLFFNVPFGLACGYAAVIGLAAFRIRPSDNPSPQRGQRAAALGVMTLGLVFVLLAEQGYSYWYSQNKYVQLLAQWEGSAAYTIAMCWSVYGLALLAAALRFDKLWLKAMAALTAGAAIAAIVLPLPLHTDSGFRLMLNLPFTAWITVAASLIAGHGLWRMIKASDRNEGRLMAQVYYAAGVLLAAIGFTMEWYAHCRWHIEGATGDAYFALGTILLFSAVILALLMRPLAPEGSLVRALGVTASLPGAIFVVNAQSDVHTAAFRMFANVPFAIAMVFIAAMAVGTWLLRREKKDDPWFGSLKPLLPLATLLLVWILLSQEVYYYWHCQNRYAGPVDNWRFSAQMFMSVVWAIYAAALMVGGFVFRQRGVRYLSMAIFAVLLAKIFLIDTMTVRTEYRIAAFLTTGLILVGVSFVYQFLKKKGFFEEKANVKDAV